MSNAEAAGGGGARPWPLSRYLLTVALITAAAIGALGWARPSLFTSPLVVAGLGVHVAEPRPDSFYAVRVAPILEAQCAGCHGPRLQRARLRLDTLGDVMLGGKSGRVVVGGHPQASEMYTRLLLPKSDRRAMPAGSKPPLSEDEIRVIELWIAAGASGNTRVEEIANAPPPPSAPVKVAESDEVAVAKAREPLAQRVRELGERYPGVIAYLSRSSAELSVDAQRLGASFGDDDLARLTPVATAVSRMDLSGTAVTDAAAKTLAGFVRLESLRLNRTRIGDETLAALAEARGLDSLAVIETQASRGRVAELRQRGVRVYDAGE